MAASYAPLVGHDVSLAQIYEVARNITDLYAKAGYALSFALVPAQDIDKSVGNVRIDVVEGYIGEVRYDGDTEGLAKIVGEYGENITQSKPLKTPSSMAAASSAVRAIRCPAYSIASPTPPKVIRG